MANPNPQNQFQKGESGNLKGRPKREWTWASLMEKVSEELTETGITKKELLVNKLFGLAIRGNIVAIKEILNRMDGMPARSTDITSGDKPLPVPIMGGLSGISVISYKDAIKLKSDE